MQQKAFLNEGPANGGPQFYLTDIPHRFSETGRLFLGKEISNIQVIDI